MNAEIFEIFCFKTLPSNTTNNLPVKVLPFFWTSQTVLGVILGLSLYIYLVTPQVSGGEDER